MNHADNSIADSPTFRSKTGFFSMRTIRRFGVLALQEKRGRRPENAPPTTATS